MGIDLLEKKFQTYAAACPQNLDRLREIAGQVSLIQQRMRRLFADITPVLCSACAAPCCQCMPVEGWFTECDYMLYRMLYDAPFALRIARHDGRSCLFLGAHGCVLPEDMRPFPCVKVNCRKVSETLAARGLLDEFTRLNSELEHLQEAVFPLLADIISDNVLQAQSYDTSFSM